jgi:hypothetical protein
VKVSFPQRNLREYINMKPFEVWSFQWVREGNFLLKLHRQQCCLNTCVSHQEWIFETMFKIADIKFLAPHKLSIIVRKKFSH